MKKLVTKSYRYEEITHKILWTRRSYSQNCIDMKKLLKNLTAMPKPKNQSISKEKKRKTLTRRMSDISVPRPGPNSTKFTGVCSLVFCQ